MPIYAFQCAECGHDFDRLQKMSDPDPESCPSCGESAVKRQLTAPSFRLSGSGWYETDFKKDGDKKRNLTEAGDGGGKAESKSEGGDAKPATPSGDSAPVSKPEPRTEAKPTPGAEAKPAPKPAAPSTPAA